MLVGRVVTFSIRANHQLEVCVESRLSLSLDDSASETSLTLPGDLGLCVSVWTNEDLGYVCVFGLTRTSGLNRGSL